MIAHEAKTLYERLLLIRQLVQECYTEHADQVARTKKKRFHVGQQHQYPVELSRELLGVQDDITNAIHLHEDMNALSNTTKAFAFSSQLVDHNLPFVDMESIA